MKSVMLEGIARLGAEVLTLINGLIDENLKDPDLADKSEDYRAGYAHGMREALITQAVQKARSMR